MPRPPGAKTKLREYLLQHVGEVLDSETLRVVAGTSEWGRRIRELRDEEGMNILTHNDLASLRPGQYLLRDLNLRPAFARTVSKEVRAFVLERNGFTCQMCGAGAGEPHPFDGSKTRLHIGHVIERSQGGADEPENLRAICSICNEGAANVTAAKPDSVRLLAQLRRAPGTDQVQVLEWLIQKYPERTRRLLED